MYYIVVDFEWNQSPYGKNASNKHLPFEIIEIGAVKLDAQLQIIDRFDAVIKPRVYRKMHHITKSLTGITDRELSRGTKFQKALIDFMAWCGEDFVFCTWGNLDLLELQRNMRFYDLDELLPGPIKYYNVQKLFRILYNDERSAMSLEKAVDYMGIEKGPDFHRAVYDAEYTAEIFSRMDQGQVQKWYSVDYFQNPKCRKEEIKLVYETYSKYVSKEYETKEAAIMDREVRSTRCFKCGKAAAKKIRWFSGKNKIYYCLAQCTEHGYIRGKIRIKRAESNRFYAVKTLWIVDEEGAGHIADMKDEMRLKRQEKRHREGLNES